MKVRGQTVYLPDERIARMILVSAETGCWNWTGARRNGYGRLMVGSRSTKRVSVAAHRYSYGAYIGIIPDGMHICHHCDNRACVNPSHLFAGTRQENTDDRERKGRNRPPKGSKNGQSKLREVDVLSMRRLRSKGLAFSQLAERFGVSKKTAIQAVKGESWKHIPAPPTEDE